MATLLVLGSKPAPEIPPRALIDAVACANASGHSAARLGLPEPDYTVMTAVLASGKRSDDHSLRVLRGLSTDRLLMLPRPRLERSEGLLRAVRARLKAWRMSPWWLRRRLHGLGYRWRTFVVHPASWYHALVLEVGGKDPALAGVMAAKQPSTGIIAVALGLADARYDRVVMAGFDFTLAHAYGTNPLIDDRQTSSSKHADTDIMALGAFVARGLPLFTTEPAVNAKAGVPWLADAPTCSAR
jgi:hypothetical protein